jgi:tight adherence protein B
MDLSSQAILIYLLTFTSVFVLVNFGWRTIHAWVLQQEAYYDRVLNHQLLLNVSPRLALACTVFGVLMIAIIGYLLGGVVFFVPFGLIAFLVPWLVIRHLDQKRKEKLDVQLVDGIVTIASGVRAGLTLVQAMELLVQNHAGPIQQEFGQLLREYQMGLDLNQAMRNCSNRVGLSNYRLVFTAIEMHRLRGGNSGESLDRIAESIREIQRLEGKLDAITAQGRMQATMIALAPIALIAIFYVIDPVAVTLLFSEPMGRVILLISTGMVVAGWMWIRKIMTVDI